MPPQSVTTSTRVTYPAGAVTGESLIVRAFFKPIDQSALHVVVDETPFHPMDYWWPDQPGDRGSLLLKNEHREVFDSTIIGVSPQGTFYSSESIPVARGKMGWRFLVAHLITPFDVEPDCLVGEPAQMRVDATYRLRLSGAHTVSHLVALALNKVTRGAWSSSDPERDSLGNPDLAKAAIVQSHIGELSSIDRYRLGRSLYREGFDVRAHLARADQREELRRAIEGQVATWLEEEALVRMTGDTSFLDAARLWECQLSDGPARVPCGGTHVGSLAELRHVRVDVDQWEDHEDQLEVRARAELSSESTD